jgi:hypothetical protein
VSRILVAVLTIALLIGLSPRSNHMLSMQGMKMDVMAASNQSNMDHEGGDKHSASSCCDAVTPCPLGLDFLTSQPANIASYGGSKRVASPPPTVQSIDIKTLSPPPKA